MIVNLIKVFELLDGRASGLEVAIRQPRCRCEHGIFSKERRAFPLDVLDQIFAFCGVGLGVVDGDGDRVLVVDQEDRGDGVGTIERKQGNGDCGDGYKRDEEWKWVFLDA
jgi:hypothetical protein